MEVSSYSSYLRVGGGVMGALVALSGGAFIVALSVLCGLDKNTVFTSSHMPTAMGSLTTVDAFVAIIIGATAAYYLLSKPERHSSFPLDKKEASPTAHLETAGKPLPIDHAHFQSGDL